jgi:pyrroloquinoline quinone biosynthesis protein B
MAMFVRLLGTAAGGGFPQWNCTCANCITARTNPTRARPRTQSSAAVSADGRRWFLLNASPEVPAQLASLPFCSPDNAVRDSRIEAVLLTCADLDHILGLFLLREGNRLVVHASGAVRRALDEGLRLTAVLNCYSGIDWREPPLELAPLCAADGAPSGLQYRAFSVSGKPPRYRERQAGLSPGDCVGYRLVDERTGGRLIYVPGMAALDDAALCECKNADLLLIDGSFWSDTEMAAAGAGPLSATEMGHLPVGGPDGSLARVSLLTARRKVYVHINNTNPMLREDSAERLVVEKAGAEVGYDGMEFAL